MSLPIIKKKLCKERQREGKFLNRGHRSDPQPDSLHSTKNNVLTQ